MKICVVFLLLSCFPLLKAQQAQRISPPGINYIDPETYSERNWLAFQMGNGQIWLGKLDSLTGTFLNPNGLDLYVDSSDVPLLQSFNGPEFAWDAQGWSVVYTKRNQGTPQPWRRVFSGPGQGLGQPMGFGAMPRLSVLATKDSSAGETWLVYGKGPTLDQGLLAYTSANQPNQEVVLDSLDEGARWITGEEAFVYIPRSGAWQGNIVLREAPTGNETLLVQDNYTKTYAYAWWAPEFQGIGVLAILNDSLMGVYGPNGNGQWTLHSAEKAPASAGNYRFFGSPEAFVCGGKSYITTVLKEQATTSSYVPAQVWVLGIEPSTSGNRIEIRADNGIDPVVRTDPESYVGKDQAFSIYNVIQSGIFEVWSCSTGISTQPAMGNSTNNPSKPPFAFPNPVEDRVFIPDAFPQNQWLKVVNHQGQERFEYLENGYLFTRPWSQGSYVVEYHTKKGIKAIKLLK